MDAIRLEEISKKFRNRNLQSQHTTLKSLILRKSRFPTNNNFLFALKEINLSIKKGQTIGIIGHNGSGKSTLLKIISKIYRPDSGKMHINGRVSTLIELGAGFHPEFSGRENVFINGIILGLSKKEIKERFDSIVKYANLENFIDAPVRTYSSGMYMRLGFSIAVNINPDILLIDEVLAVGDEAFSRKCNDRIEELQENGKTLMIVSHDLNAIEKWCDEVIWLNNGSVQDIGRPNKIIDLYKNSVAKSEHDIEEEKAIKSGNVPLEQGRRWGSKEIEIVSIRLLDSKKKERFSYSTGEKITIEIGYKTHKHVEEPVFGFGIHRTDGICCYGSNTHIENIPLKGLKKDGIVRIEIGHLDLIESLYHLDIAVHDKNDYAYDYLSRCLSFLISSDIKDSGIFRVKHKWELE
tara:strand:+ start:184 stop:1407 length:1224 start_codon:yes stop_codon:yes gene_type:complete